MGWRLILGLLLLPFSLHGELAPHRVQVSLNLSSRPLVGVQRDQEVFFDQHAVLNVKVKNPTDGVQNLFVRWAMLYDEIPASGRAKQLNLAGSEALSVAKGEEQTVASRMLRLNGKITKKGQLIGLNHIGYGVQIFENGKLAFEKYDPVEVRTDARDILVTVALDKESHPVAKAGSKSTKPAAPDPDKDALLVAPPGQVTMFELTFSTKESRKILQTVNEFSLEDLCSRVGLSKNSAQQIVVKRPVANLEELARIPYVKKQAFGLLKAFVNSK